MSFKPVIIFVCLFVFAACAQTNTTVSAPLALYNYAASIATCPARDQILRLNQLLSIENVNLAYFRQLETHLNNITNSANIGLPTGVSLTALRGNVSTIINQITQITSFLNSTVTSGCASLPAADSVSCYVWAPCNYTFGNLTALTGSSNRTSSGNSTGSSNSTSSGPSASALRTALNQGWYMCDQTVIYIGGTVILITNTTLQYQLMEFEALHAAQSTFFRVITQAQPIITPQVLSSSNIQSFSRTPVVTGYASFVSDRACCDGFRGVSV